MTQGSIAAPPSERGRRRASAAQRPSWGRPPLIRVGQIAVWELAALAILGTVNPLRWLGILAITLGVLALLLTSIPVRGRYGYQWAIAAVRFRFRRQSWAAVAPLTAVLPDLQVRGHIDQAGNRVGLAGVGDGWTAVLRLTSPQHAEPATLLAALNRALERPDIRLASAQLVVWSVPGVGPAEAVRVCWLALRYRPTAAPQAALARGGGRGGALRATAVAALTLARDLAESGHPCVVLDETALPQQLLVTLSAGPVDGTPTLVQETWRGWTLGSFAQSCHRARSADLVGMLVPGSSFTCTSVTLTHGVRDRLHTRVVVRVGAPAGVRPAYLNALVKASGARLARTDGRHADHVRVSIPLALPVP